MTSFSNASDDGRQYLGVEDDLPGHEPRVPAPAEPLGLAALGLDHDPDPDLLLLGLPRDPDLDRHEVRVEAGVRDAASVLQPDLGQNRLCVQRTVHVYSLTWQPA